MEKKQQHTPEPWEVKFNSYEDSEGIIQHNTGPNWSLWIVEKMAESESDIANARRIVSCVNALAGIENPEKFVAQAEIWETQTIEMRKKIEEQDQRIASLTEQVERGEKVEYECNADCPDVNLGNCCHPSNCQKKPVKSDYIAQINNLKSIIGGALHSYNESGYISLQDVAAFKSVLPKSGPIIPLKSVPALTKKGE